MPSASKVTTDHEEIRAWAEERGGRPAHVMSTGKEDDPGILRIDFPGYSGEGSLEEIEWDEWFDKFDERGLALLYQDTTAGGEKSNFNKIVSRETAQENEDRSHRSSSRGSGSRSSRGKRASASSRVNKTARTSSDRSSRSREATRSRNQNRSEGRSSKKATTSRSSQGAGRSSSRSRTNATSRKESRSSGKAASRSTGRKPVRSAGKSRSKRATSSRSSNRRAA
jgi:hypothetical protein